MDTWVTEHQETLDLWHETITRKTRHDNRPRPQLLMDVVDRTQVFTVPANKSMIIKDRATNKVVMVVIRSFVRDPSLLSYIDGIIQASVNFWKSI